MFIREVPPESQEEAVYFLSHMGGITLDLFKELDVRFKNEKDFHYWLYQRIHDISHVLEEVLDEESDDKPLTKGLITKAEIISNLYSQVNGYMIIRQEIDEKIRQLTRLLVTGVESSSKELKELIDKEKGIN